MLKALSGLLLITLCAVTPAYSQEPPQSGRQHVPTAPKQNPSAKPQKQSPTETRGTDQNPVSVKVVSAPEAKTETPEERESRLAREANEQGLMNYTRVLANATIALCVIAGLQAGLFLWQLGYMRSGLRDAKTTATAAEGAAIAAQLQAKEMAKASALAASQAETTEKLKEIQRLQYYATHVPRMEVRFVRLRSFNQDKPPDQQPIAAEFIVVNTGATEARVTGSKVAFVWLFPEDVPLPTDLSGQNVIPERRFGVGATDKAIVWSDDLGGANLVNETKKQLYLLGWIVYVDGRGEEFGDSHTSYFARVFDRGTERLETFGGIPDWNFIH